MYLIYRCYMFQKEFQYDISTCYEIYFFILSFCTFELYFINEENKINISCSLI